MKSVRSLVLFVCLAAPCLSQTRMISHVARDSTRFESSVILFNASAQEGTFSLSPFTMDGSPLPCVDSRVAGSSVLVSEVSALFGSTEVSHFSITSDANISVEISYHPIGSAAPLRVRESSTQAQRWHLFPSDWTALSDGVAFVNTGSAVTDVVVEQRDSAGQLLASELMVQALVPSAKAVAILTDHFDWIEGCRFELVASQPLALTSLSFGIQDDDSMSICENRPLEFETGKWRADGGDVFMQGGSVENRMPTGQRLAIGSAFDLLQAYPSYPNWVDYHGAMENNPGVAALDDMGNLRAWMGQVSVPSEQPSGTIYTLGTNGSRNFAVGSTSVDGGYVGIYNQNSHEEASLFSGSHGGGIRVRYDGSARVLVNGEEGGGSLALHNSESETKVFMGIDENGNGILEVDGAFTSKIRHPESSSEIRYSGLSGGEQGIYHRGIVTLKNGRAWIDLPEHFKALANRASMTVNLTPTSFASKGLAVGEISQSRIEIGELFDGKGNYEVHYLIHAFRKGTENYKTMVPMTSGKTEMEEQPTNL